MSVSNFGSDNEQLGSPFHPSGTLGGGGPVGGAKSDIALRVACRGRNARNQTSTRVYIRCGRRGELDTGCDAMCLVGGGAIGLGAVLGTVPCQS